MSTPKTAQFKLRQREFKKLNSMSTAYSVSRGTLDATGDPIKLPIKHPIFIKDDDYIAGLIQPVLDTQ
jgi:hypothetical protein